MPTTSIGRADAQSNLFTPERLDGETRDDYRARRAAAKSAVRRMTAHGAGKGVSSRRQLRDTMRSNGNMGKRIRAADALMAHWASKRVTKSALSDEHGAYTLTGAVFSIEGMKPDGRVHVISAGIEGGEHFFTARRKWLGGISEQRGC
jgi:hypothetical protein